MNKKALVKKILDAQPLHRKQRIGVWKMLNAAPASRLRAIMQAFKDIDATRA